MRRSPNKPREAGFALLIVLWSLVLLSLLIGHVIATGRGETRIAANIRSAAMAEAAADGAVFTAVFHMMDMSPARWPADGQEHRLAFGDARATVRTLPLAGKVNPNLASNELISALLRVLGTSPGQADSVARAMGDWHYRVFHDDQRETRMIPYRTAGLDYGPPLTPLESIEELNRVQGMTPALLAALEPHLTLYRSGDPDPAYADPEVRQALQLLNAGKPPLPPFSNTFENGAVEIEATAIAGGARFVRRAVVDVQTTGNGYAVLSWEDGEAP